MRYCPTHQIKHVAQEIHGTGFFKQDNGHVEPAPMDKWRFYLARDINPTLYPTRKAAWEAYCPWVVEHYPNLTQG